MSAPTPDYYRATKDFEFGGVRVRMGEPVPCHRDPWTTLLQYGQMFVEPVWAEGTETP